MPHNGSLPNSNLTSPRQFNFSVNKEQLIECNPSQITMSHFFPKAAYAEDQPLATTILTTHVLSRGFQVGTALGPLSRAALSLKTNQPLPSAALLRAAGTGGIVGTGILTVALIGRMWGREEIEWKDRSWRLLNHKGQVAVDDWSQVGGVLGGTLGATRRGVLGWRGVVGAGGVGSLVGIVGCLGYGWLKGEDADL
ncbi:hypothetical protein BJX63DRAFT_385512 [Aspergillus granulosus]|uniref:Uncharacterized protein n=1 Tax=Aspergillus granulosus TaxID=176169 RepID=A0ABR4HQ36_9EURO